MENIGIYTQSIPTYTLRHETLNGVDHLVVPVVMMVEGVHSGSRGPLLHLTSELEKSAPAWNGVPVTIQHPQDAAGNYISANAPQVLQDWATGIVFNAHMDGGRLVGEAWVRTATVTTLSPDTFTALTTGQALEVSVGVFSDEEESAGMHANESYTAIARNHRPDHLALLPGGQGACSLTDGCGVRVYTKIKGGKNEMVKKLQVNQENIQEILKDLNLHGYDAQLIVCEQSLQDRISAVRSHLYAMDTDQLDHYVREVYADYLIYRVYTRNTSGEESTEKLYKQSYAIVGDTVQWVGERAEVVKNVTYDLVPTTNLKRTRYNTNQEDLNMSKECTPCVKARVDGLIAHTKSNFQEVDRPWLETLEEVALEKLCPDKVPAVETPAVNTTAPKVDFFEGAPAGMKEQVQMGLAMYALQLDKVVAAVIANTAEGTWDEATLKAMPFETLQKIELSVRPEGQELEVNDFTGMAFTKQNAGEMTTNANQEDMPQMLPAGITVNKTEAK